MGNIFIRIYDYFSKNKAIMWILLCVMSITMAYFSLQVKYEEDITSFFPEQEQDLSLILNNLKAKDRLVVMFTANEDELTDSLIDAAESFRSLLNENKKFTSIANFSTGVEDIYIDSMSQFVYDNLPLFLTDKDYENLDTIINPAQIKSIMEQNYNNIISPIGSYVTDFIYNDPLSLAGNALKNFQRLGNSFNYKIIDDYIFSPDKKTLLAYIDIPSKTKSSGKLIKLVESEIEEINKVSKNINVEYFGTPAVAKYNEWQIKKDNLITLNIAIIIVIIFVTIALRNRFSIILLLVPALFGALLALSIIYFTKGEISLIAVGSGSIIYGIALSYAIHVLSHKAHSKDIRTLIKDLTFPLTVGSFTTIGAFIGLTFTNSKLLQDFGLFASITLAGSAIFSLIFLPHFIKIKEGQNTRKELKVLDKLSNLRLDRNRPFVISIFLITIVLSIFFNDIKFDSNMMNLNYNPPHLKEAEDRLNSLTQLNDNESNIVFVTSSKEVNSAANNYNKLCNSLDSLQSTGKIVSYSDINQFVISKSEQKRRLDRWDEFWTEQKQSKLVDLIDKEANILGFEEGAFDGFNHLLSKEYGELSFDNQSLFSTLFNEWINSNDSLTTLIAHVKIENEKKDEVYKLFQENKNIVAVDRAYFANMMAKDVRDNFYFILYISGILIFSALLLSYGRIELAILAFLPMFISWIIILGIMSIFGIEFNIVTIILSTFIFGIGDDFSIFVMDGLEGEYKYKTKLLQHHKVAIILSAFSLIVGMGVLVFAKHPAMNSLGLISLIGMAVVVIISYTIQPFIYRLFITQHTDKGNFPVTFLSLLNTIYAFGLFVSGCLLVQAAMLTVAIFPINRDKKKYLIHSLVSWYTRSFLKVMITVKMININEVGESFKKPAVVIANHQSFIDILLLLGLNRKFVMVTNGWVWNSPIFGAIVRYLGFFHTADGYENIVESLNEKVKQGYSVIIFPEGSRSPDNKIKRFHKGAFFLAEKLKLDIIPILIYGNGLISSKRQPIYIKKGVIVSKVLERITYGDSRFGETYKDKTKNINRYFREEYDKLYEEFNRVRNPYFKDALIKNYIFKGPVLEWYMRIKLRMENYYDHYDRLLPRSGFIVDLGCGYGALSYMLMMLSDKRRVLGVDYDAEKINLANNCFAKSESINFEAGDIRTYNIPKADAYVISDVLHYIDSESQVKVINSCIENLNQGGMIIIRDGDTSLKERHHNTEKTEEWSTKILKFNKTDGPLCFLSKEMIIGIAEKNNMSVKSIESDSKTSNTLFILTGK